MPRKFKWGSKLLSKIRIRKKPDAAAGAAGSAELNRLQKNIYRQAALAGLTIVLTVVILFAMTSAWYTNIVRTSGLVFEAEPWGFDGTITVSEESILAGPGDDGIVSLQVQNTSDSLSALSVSVSKTSMASEMQKRLFFYVDTHMTRDDETMERVYLNESDSYTYTVFGNGQLTLTEQLSNAPQIKWEWVYDVLGYYVMAYPIRDENESILSMGIQDYLRPIEYDLDQATTKYETDASGVQTVKLLTVDGTTGLDTYLVLQSMKDGYEGSIDVYNKVVYDSNGKPYYEVDVDENGNGVYAYLCDYSEIQAHTKWDTDLGQLAYEYKKDPASLTTAQIQRLYHEVTINISAQRSETSTVSVTNLSALNTAIAEGYADVIQLGSDITLSESNPLVIPENTRAMIDLNENTIKGVNTSGAIIKAQQGSSLTLINGDITGTATGTGTVRGIETLGAEVIMSNVDLSGFDCGVYMGDHTDADNALDSRVHLMNCTIDAGWYGVFINGNGINSEQKTQLIIEKSIVSGDGYAIVGNGSANDSGRWGTDIQIINSTIEQKPENGGTGAAIYMPQKDSSLIISQGSAVSGYTGICLKGGTAVITDSTVTGWGNPANPAAFSDSGFTDTADAVYIETNYGYDISLEITGSTLTSNHGKSLQVYQSTADNVFVQIVSGTFDQDPGAAYVSADSAGAYQNSKYVITEKE